MLDFARSVRNLMDRLSSMTVMGVHVDWFFHMFGAAVIVIMASRFLSRRIVLWGTIALLIGKELFDVFAKTRAEYIRPPGIDLIFDLTSGLVGLALGLYLVKRFGWGKRS